MGLQARIRYFNGFLRVFYQLLMILSCFILCNSLSRCALLTVACGVCNYDINTETNCIFSATDYVLLFMANQNSFETIHGVGVQK